MLLSLALAFISQNVAAVEIGFLLLKASMSSTLTIFFALITGYLLGWVSHGYFLYRKSKAKYVYLR